MLQAKVIKYCDLLLREIKKKPAICITPILSCLLPSSNGGSWKCACQCGEQYLGRGTLGPCTSQECPRTLTRLPGRWRETLCAFYLGAGPWRRPLVTYTILGWDYVVHLLVDLNSQVDLNSLLPATPKESSYSWLKISLIEGDKMMFSLYFTGFPPFSGPSDRLNSICEIRQTIFFKNCKNVTNSPSLTIMWRTLINQIIL